MFARMMPLGMVAAAVLGQPAWPPQPVYCVFRIDAPEVWIDTMTIRVRNTGTGVAHGVTLWACCRGTLREEVRGTIPRLEPGRSDRFEFPVPFESGLGTGKLREESYRVTYQTCQTE